MKTITIFKVNFNSIHWLHKTHDNKIEFNNKIMRFDRSSQQKLIFCSIK